MLRVRSRAAVHACVGLVLTSAALAACGSDPDEGERARKARPSVSATTSQAPQDYLSVPPTVVLTEPGTALALGQEGVVAFQRRQDEVGALGVTVQAIELTSFKRSFKDFTIDPATAQRTPFFVRLQVTNVGDLDLGGFRLDNVLYADDGTTLEAPNYYTAEQLPACTGGALPVPFGADATTTLCQVYFIAAGRQLKSVSFVPFGGLEAVTWSGAYTKPGKAKASDAASGAASDPAPGAASESASVSPAATPSATPTP